jgi:hypothetical protein
VSTFGVDVNHVGATTQPKYFAAIGLALVPSRRVDNMDQTSWQLSHVRGP